MNRLLIVSNRLPVTAERRGDGIGFKPSVGGVATGIGTYHASHESVWVGWAEVPLKRLDAASRERITHELATEHGCRPVFLTPAELAGFYHGFSNRTLWPLFHHFARYAEIDAGFWRTYERVNRKYRDAVLDAYRPGDAIWVHDYQLLLLPALLREELPDAAIGFFLHIPFPSYELFRLLPWRRQLLEGMIGADLLGFHTYDYARHFLTSCRSLLGLEDRGGTIEHGGRIVRTDAFPMGIDFARYDEGARSEGAERESRRVLGRGRGKVVLSVDRLDYTKGIPERLRAFDEFLDTHPEWRGRVTLVCVAVPSRTRVERYRRLKREVDGLVGHINGRWATMDWTPVRYLYRALPFETLVGLYAAADVALVTPLRDGMNLIAKEYVAAVAPDKGVLVLSEMAGAARELGDAIIVNPYDSEEVVSAIARALEMAPEEKAERNAAMRERLRRYDVARWVGDFLGELERVKLRQAAYDQHTLTPDAHDRLVDAFRTARQRLLLLDYDGTLVPFAPTPEAAAPDARLLELLGRLTGVERSDVVVISGRPRATLEEWLAPVGVGLVAEHGAWIRESGEWATLAPLDAAWKERLRPVLEAVADRTPGSFVEEKDHSLVWHYRNVHPELAKLRARDLVESLGPLTEGAGLSVLEGDKVLEIRSSLVDKGRAAHRWMGRASYDFVLALGDDRTDEDLFDAAPPDAWTVKVGWGPSHAKFSLAGPEQARRLLADLLEVAK